MGQKRFYYFKLDSELAFSCNPLPSPCEEWALSLYSVSSCHLWCCRPRLPPLWDVCRLKSTSVGSPPSGDAVPMPLMVPNVLLWLLLSSSVSFEMIFMMVLFPKHGAVKTLWEASFRELCYPWAEPLGVLGRKELGKKRSEADSWLGKLRSRALKFSQIARRSSSSLLDQRPSCLQQKCQQQQQLRQLE